MRVIGMISGTSYDGVDAAALDLTLDGTTLQAADLGLLSVPMPAQLRADIAATLPPAGTTLEQVCRLDAQLGQLFADVATRACAELADGQADLVVSHGQTVFHWVADGAAQGTLQLGAPGWIAAATGVPVVSDLRTTDIALGGQGAPLVPIFDDLLILSDAPRRAALNLGGIANLTVRVRDKVIAYDIGPANALVDATVSELTGGAERMDTGGERAARGIVRTDVLNRLLSEPYYAAAPPKSTGKELFHAAYVADRLARLDPVRPDDLVATLTELTAVLVARACEQYGVVELVAAGGGVRNPVLMGRIRELCTPSIVSTVDDFGISAQAKEACAFAVLGFLTAHGLPGTIAGTTSASRPAVLGSITPGSGPLRLPEPAPVAPTRMVVSRI
jgi:anhydro-N-acetylmuramic acid kinase